MGGNGGDAACGRQEEQARCLSDPARLGFACLLNGVEPVDPGRPFAWLGFDAQEPALARLAERFPHGRFYRLPDAAEVYSRHGRLPVPVGLATGTDLPDFDFVILPDTWAAAAPGYRAAAIAFLARRLKPGGVALAAYDALPGATVQAAISHLLSGYRDKYPGPPEHAFAAACAWVQDLAEAGAGFFGPGSAPLRQWEHYRETGHRLAVTALYAADVARECAAAKLVFAGSADPSRVFTEDFLAPEQEQVLAAAPDLELRETLLDFLCNTAYRCDLFVRGPRALPPARALQWFARCLLTRKANRSAPDAGAGSALPLDALAAALAQGPRTLAELSELPVFSGMPRLLLRSAARLVAQCRAEVSFLPAAAALEVR